MKEDVLREALRASLDLSIQSWGRHWLKLATACWSSTRGTIVTGVTARTVGVSIVSAFCSWSCARSSLPRTGSPHEAARMFVGVNLGGYAGWELGEKVGVMTAFVGSSIGGVLGIFAGWWNPRRKLTE